jgi:hypothetical protein
LPLHVQDQESTRRDWRNPPICNTVFLRFFIAKIQVPLSLIYRKVALDKTKTVAIAGI